MYCKYITSTNTYNYSLIILDYQANSHTPNLMTVVTYCHIFRRPNAVLMAALAT